MWDICISEKGPKRREKKETEKGTETATETNDTVRALHAGFNVVSRTLLVWRRHLFESAQLRAVSVGRPARRKFNPSRADVTLFIPTGKRKSARRRARAHATFG